jgi:hypothetical protein
MACEKAHADRRPIEGHPAIAPIGGLVLRPVSPFKPSSKEFGCSGVNPLATWRTIEMIFCTISPQHGSSP